MTQNTTFSVFNNEIVTREAQRSLFVDNKAFAIANTTLRNIAAGEVDTVVKTILSYPKSQTYTPSTDLTQRTLTGTSESLSIATWLATYVNIDDTEKLQSVVDLSKLVATRMMANLNNDIEQRVLTEVTNSTWSLDDGNVGGTSGNNIVLTTANVPEVFTAADAKLDAIDAPKNRTAVVGGHFLSKLKLQQAGRNTAFGDGVNTRGVVADLFGWKILYSNNLRWSGRLNIGTLPLDGDTITVAGVVGTFKTTQGSTAGNINIADSAANQVTMLTAMFNTPETTVAEVAADGFNAFSDENVFLWRDKRRLIATANSGYVGLTGYGDIVVSETLTAAADGWSNLQQDSLFLVPGSIDMIVQIPPKIEQVRAPLQFSTIIKSLCGFGKKTFLDGAREMVRVKIDASTSDWS